jgi:hypothetical protein
MRTNHCEVCGCDKPYTEYNYDSVHQIPGELICNDCELKAHEQFLAEQRAMDEFIE